MADIGFTCMSDFFNEPEIGRFKYFLKHDLIFRLPHEHNFQ